MRSKDIEVGGEYALIDHPSWDSRGTRVRVEEKGLDRQAWDSGAFRSHKAAVSNGILVTVLDEKTGETRMKDVRKWVDGDSVVVGQEPVTREVIPNHIVRTWDEHVVLLSEQTRVKAERVAAAERMDARRDELRAAIADVMNVEEFGQVIYTGHRGQVKRIAVSMEELGLLAEYLVEADKS